MINQFTFLDAFLLVIINELVNQIAQFQVFSTIDLKKALQQLPLKIDDRIYTAFEACGKLYQFTCLPFSITNNVACFQHIMMKFVKKKKFNWSFSILRQFYSLKITTKICRN